MAVKALPETSAISEIRFAVCSLPSESQALMPRNPNVERWPKRPAAFNHVDAALREMIAGILAQRTARPR